MNFDKLAAMSRAMYENSTLPITLTDDNLNIIWANDGALKRFPSLALRDGILELLSNYDFSKIKKILEAGNSFFAKKLPEPLNEILVVMIPILDDGKLLGCHVMFRPDVPYIGASLDSHLEKVVAAFSNEYRMPLTVIFSALGLMARHLDEVGDDISKTYVKLITQNCYRVLRLSNNITEVSRYRSGISKLKLKAGELCEYISSMCEAAGILTRSIGIPLECLVPEKKIETVFDPEKLSLVFYNLLSNSCKYTRDKNHICVKLEEQGEMAVVTVSDKGKGIKSEIIGQIFEPYFSYSEDTEISGAGLGLAIVKFIVTQHGGTIAIQSEEEDGTTVAFSIPIRKNGDLPDYVAQNSADYLADRFSSLYVQLSDICGCPLP